MSKSWNGCFGGVKKDIMQSIEKSYIQNKINFVNTKNSFFKKIDLENIYNRRKSSFNDFISKETYSPILSKKVFKSFLDYLEFKKEISVEINEAFLHLENTKRTSTLLDISEGVWNYSKELLNQISREFWFTFRKKMPKPRFNFIEDSVEIRWEVNDFKMVLSSTDYIEDIAVYVKTSAGQYISGTVQKEKVVKWVLFWLEQVLNY